MAIISQDSKYKSDLKYRCYLFSIEVIKFVSQFPNQRIYWIISDQLLRCATSIGANVVEAKSGSSRKDFIKFYEIALKSANETKYWLGLLRDAVKADKTVVNQLLAEVTEISKMLGSSILTTKSRKF